MATTPIATPAKAPKAIVSQAARVQETLTRAVLNKKITKEELVGLSDHIAKLTSIL